MITFTRAHTTNQWVTASKVFIQCDDNVWRATQTHAFRVVGTTKGGQYVELSPAQTTSGPTNSCIRETLRSEFK